MQKKQTIHQIMRDLKFLRYWWSCLTFCWFTLHATLILLSLCAFIEMVNCLNTIILQSFLIIVFTSILHLFYRTIIPPKICTTHICINRIHGPITSDVMNTVTLSEWQYAPNTRNSITTKKNWKTLKVVNCRVIPKVSPYTLSKCTQMFTWAMAF